MSSLEAATPAKALPDAVALWSFNAKPAEYAEDAAATEAATRLALNKNFEEVVIISSVVIFIGNFIFYYQITYTLPL
jgi:hypothetical protein